MLRTQRAALVTAPSPSRLQSGLNKQGVVGLKIRTSAEDDEKKECKEKGTWWISLNLVKETKNEVIQTFMSLLGRAEKRKVQEEA